ncbi:MAG: membrane protein insertase YidC [Thermomicrobiales bacterium]|nr:membrane protein insertase YidC [Thermomicrobiales bacterium]
MPIWDQYVDLLEHSLDFLAKTFSSAGLAVIVFTIVIKTILLPLTVKSIKSSKAMQELQPKIKELQKKYGKDRQRLSQETMALYSSHQVNPMAGCLPMIIQIPIFFGLYRAIANLSAGKGPDDASVHWANSFMWLDNLATPDPYKLLPILAGVFQFIQTKMMRPAGQGKVSDPQQAMMNTMMNFMPLMVVIFGWNFDSGPVIYWVTQSVYSVVQRWFITGWGSLGDWIPGLPELPEHRRLGYRAPRDPNDVIVVSGEGGVPAKTGFMGWMQKRVEEAQAQQQARAGGTAKGTTATKTTTESPSSEPRPAKGQRPVKKGAAAARAQQQRARASGDTSTSGSDDGQPSINGTRPRAVPKKSRASRPSGES